MGTARIRRRHFLLHLLEKGLRVQILRDDGNWQKIRLPASWAIYFHGPLNCLVMPAAPFTLRPHRIGDMGWVVHRESTLYFEEYGFDQTFEALIARIVADFLTNFDVAREHCWMAEVNGQRAGHIFLVKHPEQPFTAKLRLFCVEPNARGLGLGHALVNECIQFARAAGYKKITLWTQSILHAARHIYQKAGFHLVHEEPHRSFGQDLNGQTRELDL
jgi:GNAT superfamily N-acetyltransferase